ncbi:MAG: hypothetical protein KF778_14440 [Rhodocyclaceae bacterium]|nr:hypothetical protein [Rhodocyclaceae bacterium]MBX3669595.1 hypothetical protein [Rhodocyclaceae bacterium]
MHPYRRIAKLATLLALLGISWLAVAQAPASFDALLAQLGDQNFSVREQAQRELTERATGAQLSGAQIQRLQAAISSADLEVARRSERIFGAFVHSLPSYRAMKDAAGVQLLRAVEFNPADGETTRDGRFRFDTAQGRFASPRFTSNDRFLAMSAAWQEVETALLVGNAAKAQQAFDAYKTVVENFTGLDTFNLDLRTPANDLLDKDDMLARIAEARDLLVAFRFDLQNGGAADDSALPLPTPIRNAGIVPLGASLQLTLSELSAPGQLQLFGFDESDAPALAPPGFRFIGQLFSLQALAGLEVAGQIALDIEFGEIQLIGNPVTAPDTLQIVRIAGGQAFFLGGTLHDVDHLTATYAAAPSGTDSFGQFAIVEAVPAAPTLWLLLAAAGAGAGNVVRRRAGS